MKNGDMPAMAAGKILVDAGKGRMLNIQEVAANGLTKREAFAMAAMQGICANSAITESLLSESEPPAAQVARMAVVTADALLKALEY